MRADFSGVKDTRKALDIEALSPGWRQSFTDRVEKAAGGG